MLEALNKAKKRLSSRASKPTLTVLHVPDGGMMIEVKYARWQFFTGMGEWAWDKIVFDHDELIDELNEFQYRR